MKYLYLIILLILALLFSSLSSGGKTPTVPIDDASSEAQASQLEEEKPIENEAVNVADLFSYEDYQDYIESDPILPRNFIYYEDGPNKIGDFDALIIMDSTHCLYDLIDENGISLALYITDISSDKELIEKYSRTGASIGVEDMRSIDAETARLLPEFAELSQYAAAGTKYYNNGSVVYVYGTNKCNGIRWCNNGMEFRLSCTKGVNPNGINSFGDYPKDGVETFTSRLLNASTAKATVDAFNAAIK